MHPADARPAAAGTHQETPPTFFTPARIAAGMTAFLWVGLAARALRYLLRFPLWEDECFLCVNFVDRSFAELLTPLDYHQVAPPLFLWIERAAVLAFGFSEWSLRLFPFMASLAGLFLFRRLAGRLLNGPALLLAFGVFAVAYPGIRYAGEAKQYAGDLLAGLLFLTFAVECASRRVGWLWLATAATPLLFWLSYPAAFAAGGASLAMLTVLLRERFDQSPTGSTAVGLLPRLKASFADLPPAGRREWLGWAALNGAALIGFASVYVVIKRQSAAELGFMSDYWQAAFPPVSQPWKLPVWFVTTHSGDLVAWPVGGGRGASVVTGLLAAIGVAALVRRRDPFWTALLLGPAALNLFAAALQRYPYGGHMKFSMYLGPAVCLLAGWGAAAWNAQVRRNRPRLANFAAAGMLVMLAAVSSATMGRDLCRPFKTWSDERARGFAQWFWFNAEAQGEVELVETFDGRAFLPDAGMELSWTAMFLCNRAIYSPTAAGDGGFVIPGLAARPLRCVVYRDPRFRFDDTSRDAWLASMRSRYHLVGVDSYPFTRVDKRERTLRSSDWLDIYTFLPRSTDRPNAKRVAALQNWPPLR